MYDTVNIWQPAEIASNQHLLDSPDLYIDKPLVSMDGTTVQGHIGNYRVYVNQQGTSLKGSMARYKDGNSNFTPLTPKGAGEAVEQLSGALGLPLANAKVTRLDLAANIITEHRPEAYFPFMGNRRYYERNAGFPHTIYYNGKLITIAFYNKAKEAKDKIPNEYKEENILRYELRLNKSPHKALNTDIVTPEQLTNESFYRGLVMTYKAQYDAIPKNRNTLNIPVCNMRPKDVNSYLALLGIEAIGGQQAAIELIDQCKYRHDKYRCRAKQMVRELCNKESLTYEEPLITELDGKMNQLYEQLLVA